MNLDLRILIVDDFQPMLRIIRNLLSKLGLENVFEASDGSDALQKCETETYDLIISDWHMEPMNGLDLVKALRAKNNTVPFIMITAETKTENVLAAREVGVDTYIVKPFNAETLRTKIESVLPSA